MADKEITPLPFFGFPQEILNALDREIQRIDKIVEKELEQCEHESDERHTGSCDGGYPCSKRATVTDVRTGSQFCLDHFEGLIL